MTTNDVGRGVYERVSGPTGARFLVHAVPSGSLGFSVQMAHGPVAALVRLVALTIVNPVLFRGGWTLVAWRSDDYAPKRERVHMERFAGRAQALAAFDRLTATLRRSGTTAD